MIPVFGISIPFIFVLLILLLTKTPKLGVWVVGGLIVTVVFGLLIALPIGVHDGLVPSPAHEAIPLLGITVPFLFVLLIILLNKAPKVGAGVIVSVVVMGVFGAVLWLGASHRNVVEGTVREIPWPSAGQATQPNRSRGNPEVALEVMYRDAGIREQILPGNATGTVDWQPINPQPAVAAPIWSEGVENEYEADVYPSDLAAARALGRRMAEPIRKVADDPNAAITIILFQEETQRQLVTALHDALEKELPGMPCYLRADLRNLQSGEVGVTLRLDQKRQVVDYSSDDGRLADLTVSSPVQSGRIVATAFREDKNESAEASFLNKPWVEDFAGFAGEKPERQFVVARSWETCTSENEAKNQAIRDACAQISALVGQKWSTVPGRPPVTVSSVDVLEGGFIVDQFVQSFDGLSGRLWRQALLIDASAERLSRLGSHKVAQVRVIRKTWAGMILSAVGVLIVIIASYLFLNMATRGYYVWSLRIAGTVLAIAGIVSIILVLR